MCQAQALWKAEADRATLKRARLDNRVKFGSGPQMLEAAGTDLQFGHCKERQQRGVAVRIQPVLLTPLCSAVGPARMEEEVSFSEHGTLLLTNLCPCAFSDLHKVSHKTM